MGTKKSTVDEIRHRFDNDVERFSNLETGQSATIDAPLIMELVARGAAALVPGARKMLDIGCGAGNYTIRILRELPNLDCSLIDLSQPMLDRAFERVSGATTGLVTTLQSDIREADLGESVYDIVVAAMTLHHLRTPQEWRLVFTNVYSSLRPGGVFLIADLVEHSSSRLQELMWARYGDYLSGFKGDEYRDHVLTYVDHEDTPAPLIQQLDLLTEVGFTRLDVIHKHSCFAAFCGVKPS